MTDPSLSQGKLHQNRHSKVDSDFKTSTPGQSSVHSGPLYDTNVSTGGTTKISKTSTDDRRTVMSSSKPK